MDDLSRIKARYEELRLHDLAKVKSLCDLQGKYKTFLIEYKIKEQLGRALIQELNYALFNKNKISWDIVSWDIVQEIILKSGKELSYENYLIEERDWLKNTNVLFSHGNFSKELQYLNDRIELNLQMLEAIDV